MPHPEIRERDILRQILDWLKLHRIFHYRQNTGMMLRESRGKTRAVRFGAKGAPDIVCVANGRYIGLEVKRPGENLSEDQIAFCHALVHAGGWYLWVTKLDTVIHFFDEERKDEERTEAGAGTAGRNRSPVAD